MQRFIKLTFSTLVAIICLAPLCVRADQTVANDLIRRRGLVSQGDTARLSAVLAKAGRGEAITVAAIGGSITAGGEQTKNPENRYINQVATWFRKNYPNAKVTLVNAGIGGTNSFYGAMRVQDDVLSHQPDLVVLEYAVNDRADLPLADRFAESYEGVVRQLLAADPAVAVIALSFMRQQGENAQKWQEMIGRYYGLPMISFRDAWWPEIKTGRVQWPSLYADEVHPKDEGHLLASDLLISYLNRVKNDPKTSAAPRSQGLSPLPAPMLTDLYANCDFKRYEKLIPDKNEGWTSAPNGKGWTSKTPGTSIEFKFNGQVLFVGSETDADSLANVSYSIDGGKEAPLKLDAHRVPIADIPAGAHVVRFTIADKNGKLATAKPFVIWGIGSAGL
jgi:lysophospholipase L1-like esterase